ncbi:MAG: hypothetical protein JWP71_3265 [Mucilaginibacter sp.]|nr:hypothetical protein [Mucilaginibacter sp.]
MNLKINKKMKLKIYSTAVMAFIGLMAYSTANAQQTAVEPVAPQTSSPSVESGLSIAVAPRVYYSGPSTSTVSPNVYYSEDQPGDTVYRNKKRRLAEQMRALNKQMSELNREESKKNRLVEQDRMTMLRKTMSTRFDSSFSRNFGRSFTNNLKFNFDSDANLEKQVQSGEVKEKSKTISKTYPADSNDKLQIDNRYGKITVNTWAKNEFKVDIQINAYANDDAKAQKLIDQTNVTNSKENNVVAFTTAIDHSDNSWWGTRSENGKITSVRKVTINYVIYMPVKSALTITNKYGSVVLPNLDGKLNINNSYGALVAKALSNSDNVIAVKYGSANIGSLNGSDLNVSYGSLDLESADKVNATISYGPAKIGRVSTSGTFNVRYGSGLEIGDISKNLKSLTVNSSYAPVKLGSITETNVDFDVTVYMGDFLYNNATSVTSKTPDNEKGYSSTKNYKGHVGKGNADKVITVKSNYGTVKFDK